jgi:hypothetical protein
MKLEKTTTFRASSPHNVQARLLAAIELLSFLSLTTAKCHSIGFHTNAFRESNGRILADGSTLSTCFMLQIDG